MRTETTRAPLALAVLAALLGLLAGAGPAAAAEWRALVIGNQGYAHAPEALSARADARAVAEALAEAGYAVELGLDLDREEMRARLEAFADAAAEADLAVLYYSGHAMRTGGRSYLQPVDARGDTLAGLLFDGVPLELPLRLASRASAAVVLVDAAQLAGFAPQPFAEPGLADIAPPQGVLVVSAAAPGRAIARGPGRESRFARRVIDRMLVPDLPAMQAVRGLGGDIWAAGGIDPALALAAAPPLFGDPDRLDREIELAVWEAAERSGLAEDYAAYLARYPDGAFAGLARNRLARIEAERTDPAEAAEASLGLDRRARRDVQRALADLGYDTGGIDGIFGPATRGALADWQDRSGLPATGYLAPGQIERLFEAARRAADERTRREAEEAALAARADDAFWARTGRDGSEAGLRAYLDRYPEGRHADEALAGLDRIAEARRDEAAARDRRLWDAARRADAPEAYRRYLAAHPQGLYSEQARIALERIERAERARAEEDKLARIERALGLGRADRLAVELRLDRLGYPVGRPDGAFDRNARRAITGFQADQRLPSTGYLTRRTLLVLLRVSGGPTAHPGESGPAIERVLRQFRG